MSPRILSFVYPARKLINLNQNPSRESHARKPPLLTGVHPVRQLHLASRLAARRNINTNHNPNIPQAFQRYRFVLSRCEQFDPWLLDRHGYSKLISDATSVVLWAIWTNLVYDSHLVYMSVDYFYFLIDWLLWRVYVPTEPFPFAFHPPTKTGPPYSDVVEYFLCRSDGLNSLESVFANLQCSSSNSRYHTRWKMLQAIRNIFNGHDYYVGYGGSCQCGCGAHGHGPRWTTWSEPAPVPLPVVNCICLPWPNGRPREPIVVVRIEETSTTWKKKTKECDKKKKKKGGGCVVM
ncbi:hypothetical protein B0T09DRAFT_366769 [Sordaria sp. MPI-SDFR-AT-0083]|nr:hypothetical protein B0T09DRAFT_366769 [Sordaria sp. MPI-SDFR-AT-0083]